MAASAWAWVDQAMTTILITGGSGQVGSALAALPWPTGTVLQYPKRDDLDLGDPRSVERWIGANRCDAIVSVGAYTAVDKAETDVAQAWMVNAVAPAILARYAGRNGIPIVHVSTDYVFDGTSPSPYLEGEPIAPIGVYGASKEGGEQGVRTGSSRHAIIRTSWVVSATGSNFIKTMLRVGAERPSLRVVDDQHGAPTSAIDLAAVLQLIVLRMLADEAAPTGTFHYCNAGETTWCGFAREIFRLAAALGGPDPVIEAILTADYPTPARRPANSRLNCDKIIASYDVARPDWRTATASIVRELLQPSPHHTP
jgi:dTDP-4-dehydrorhamnose reductase